MILKVEKINWDLRTFSHKIHLKLFIVSKFNGIIHKINMSGVPHIVNESRGNGEKSKKCNSRETHQRFLKYCLSPFILFGQTLLNQHSRAAAEGRREARHNLLSS